MAGYNGIAWQSLQLPLAAGLNQKTDDRARPQPFLDICRDVQFDEVGGLQTRFPYAAAAGSIFGGGTISNARRIAAYGNELVLFTNDSLYSWNAQLSKWVLRSTHLAVSLTERPSFATTGDQIDGDRAELSNTVVFAWTEGAQVYAAAIDKTTGSVLVTPTAVSTATRRARLVALTTKILLFADAGSSNLTVRSIDPAAPGTAIAGAGTTVLASNYNSHYDVVKVGSQDLCVGACRRSVTTSYTVFTVTPALVVVTSTKARTCDGPIAVSTIPSGTSTQVVRGNGTNVQGDFLTTSTLADVTTGQAIGTATTTINQIAAAHRSVQTSGAFRCYVFWSVNESVGFGALFLSKFNFVDSAGTIGTQAEFINGLGVASRAFDHNGSVYLWMAFGKNSEFQGDVALTNVTQAQNAYLLYRDDALLAAKAVYNAGGGFAASTGRLPGVALTAGSTTYSWTGTEKRIASLGGGSSGYAARTPRDISFTFDSNEARRCARLGNTLYVSGGEILQYDGARTTEVGFHFYPFSFDMLKSGAGSVPTGVLAYKLGWRWQNAKGDAERSTTATIGKATMPGGPAGFVMGLAAPLTVTHKTMTDGAIAVEVWRTVVNPTPDSPFFLATSNDPTNLTNPNKYIPNVPTATAVPAVAWRDEMADATLTTKESHPENGLVLEALAPPAASILIATDTRLFLAGVAGDPDRVWYSRLRGASEVASFHDTLAVDVPRDGGAITSIAIFEDTLIVFRASAIYALPGVGLDNLGQGQNFGPARIVSLDVGAVSHETVAITPVGLIFKSSKGWQLLSGAGQVQYIGDKASDFDADTVHAVTVVETQHQVRILTSSRMIVWDYRVGQWGEWTIADGVHACMFGAAHVYLAATGTRTQLATYTGLTYGLDIETTWINPGMLVADAQNGRSSAGQSEGYVRKLQPLGEYRSAHLLRFRVAYNYLQSYVDDKIWPPIPIAVGGPLQVKHGPKRIQCQAIKLRLTAVAGGVSATNITASGGIVDDLITLSPAGLWDATLTAAAVGEAGNVVTISIGFEAGARGVDVRDHFRWSHTNQQWEPAINNVGVLMTIDLDDDPLEIQNLEEAINAFSALCSVTTGDPFPVEIDQVAMLQQIEVTGEFTDGTYTSPTGEALKLTGLGVEAGIDPGLFRRLPAAQKQ